MYKVDSSGSTTTAIRGIEEGEDDLTNEMKSKKAGREITPT